MKGNFSIKYDYYTDELFFCNLGDDYGIGYLRNALSSNSRIGTLIAHDVVEHSTSQRRKKYVTYEDEIRAIGAVSFVRCGECFDMYRELLGQLESIHRDIKPVPYIIGKFLLKDYLVSPDMMRHLIHNGVSPANARNSVYQYAWGCYQKECQFNFCNDSARCAFDFIEKNIPHTIQEISDAESWGASIYFDTNKHIFRHRMKWNY
jgi:hypothetical protein